MRPGAILHLGIKELRSLARDPVMVGLIVFAFTFGVYSATKSMPETLNKAAIVIVDEDHSAVSARIEDAFHPPYFQRPRLIGQAEMDRRMDQGLDTFALDIPPNFQRDLLAGRRPTIQLNVDATRMSQGFTGSGYVQTIVLDEAIAFLRRHRAVSEPAVDLALRVRFNPQLNKSWFAAIMEVINHVTMLSLVLTGAALIREREHGTVEHLLVMPITPFEIMAGKVWAMGCVVLVACALSLVLVVEALIGVRVQGSIPLFLAGVAFQLFATTSMGIFLATMARSMPQFGLLLILILLPLEMLSGGTTPRESMPHVVQYLMLLAPNTHFVSLAQSILFRGAGLDIVWPQFVAIALIGAVLFGIALARFRKTISSMV
jgi:ABC-2 type transport system permease protein